MADRIQARAIRRCGELLKLIPASKGGDPSLFRAHEGTHTSVVTRTEAAREAGLSEFQKVTALRVATIPALIIITADRLKPAVRLRSEPRNSR